MRAMVTAVWIAALPAAALAAAGLQADQPNTLTARERAEGWALLFDGKSTDRWRGYKQDAVPAAWKVADGTLTLEGSGGDIITKDRYENFDFRFEWKIAPKGNSGVFYLVQEKPELARTYHSGPEYQVLDNGGHPDAKNGSDRFAAANYALHAPSKDVTRPVGEWNQGRIVKRGAHVEHWLNGEKVVEYELWSDDWKTRVAKSKFSQMPEYAGARKGHLALQDHGDVVSFRNLKVKALPAAEGTNN